MDRADSTLTHFTSELHTHKSEIKNSQHLRLLNLAAEASELKSSK